MKSRRSNGCPSISGLRENSLDIRNSEYFAALQGIKSSDQGSFGLISARALGLAFFVSASQRRFSNPDRGIPVQAALGGASTP